MDNQSAEAGTTPSARIVTIEIKVTQGERVFKKGVVLDQPENMIQVDRKLRMLDAALRRTLAYSLEVYPNEASKKFYENMKEQDKRLEEKRHGKKT